jgi:hypothetical protein
MEKRGYDPAIAHGQSRLANIYMTNGIERRYGPRGLHGWSVHPGGIRIGLQRFSFSDMFMVFRAGAKHVRNTLQNAEQGASTMAWAATSRTLEGKGGKYLKRCSESMPDKKDYGPLDPGHTLHVYDEGQDAGKRR